MLRRAGSPGLRPLGSARLAELEGGRDNQYQGAASSDGRSTSPCAATLADAGAIRQDALDRMNGYSMGTRYHHLTMLGTQESGDKVANTYEKARSHRLAPEPHTDRDRRLPRCRCRRPNAARRP